LGFVYFQDDFLNAYLALLAIEATLVALCVIDRTFTIYLVMPTGLKSRPGFGKTSQTVMYHQISGPFAPKPLLKASLGWGTSIS